jgi:uncharacterized cupin superfamily protein
MPADKPALHDDEVPMRVGTGYPPPHDVPCRQRGRRRLSDAFGLAQFGANLLELPPGAWSSQRHWHERQDEYIYVVEGEVVLVTDAGETRLAAGMWGSSPTPARPASPPACTPAFVPMTATAIT